MKHKTIIYTGLLFITLVLLTTIVLVITLMKAKELVVEPATEQTYQVDHIQNGDWILFDPQDPTNNRIAAMEEVYQHKVNVMPMDLITLYLDADDNIIHVEVLK